MRARTSKNRRLPSNEEIDETHQYRKATDAAISPDGRYVVHVVSDGGKQSLWLRQVSPASNRQIIPPADVDFYPGVTFSVMVNTFYYGVFEKEIAYSVLYQVPMLGGTARS